MDILINLSALFQNTLTESKKISPARAREIFVVEYEIIFTESDEIIDFFSKSMYCGSFLF